MSERDRASRRMREVRAPLAPLLDLGTIVPMLFTQRTMELCRQGRVHLPTLPKADASAFRLTEVEGGIQDILREVRGA